jgi:hypothetical protein
VTDERRPRPNAPPRQPPVTDEEFRRALERETDLSLREDPERRRFYRAGDLPRHGSPSGEPLTWEGETLTLAEWAERTGIRVKTLLERCRKGWSVEQVLTTPAGGSTRSGRTEPGPSPGHPTGSAGE